MTIDPKGLLADISEKPDLCLHLLKYGVENIESFIVAFESIASTYREIGLKINLDKVSLIGLSTPHLRKIYQISLSLLLGRDGAEIEALFSSTNQDYVAIIRLISNCAITKIDYVVKMSQQLLPEERSYSTIRAFRDLEQEQLALMRFEEIPIEERSEYISGCYSITNGFGSIFACSILQAITSVNLPRRASFVREFIASSIELLACNFPYDSASEGIIRYLANYENTKGPFDFRMLPVVGRINRMHTGFIPPFFNDYNSLPEYFKAWIVDWAKTRNVTIPRPVDWWQSIDTLISIFSAAPKEVLEQSKEFLQHSDEMTDIENLLKLLAKMDPDERKILIDDILCLQTKYHINALIFIKLANFSHAERGKMYALTPDNFEKMQPIKRSEILTTMLVSLPPDAWEVHLVNISTLIQNNHDLGIIHNLFGHDCYTSKIELMNTLEFCVRHLHGVRADQRVFVERVVKLTFHKDLIDATTPDRESFFKSCLPIYSESIEKLITQLPQDRRIDTLQQLAPLAQRSVKVREWLYDLFLKMPQNALLNGKIRMTLQLAPFLEVCRSIDDIKQVIKKLFSILPDDLPHLLNEFQPLATHLQGENWQIDPFMLFCKFTPHVRQRVVDCILVIFKGRANCDHLDLVRCFGEWAEDPANLGSLIDKSSLRCISVLMWARHDATKLEILKNIAVIPLSHRDKAIKISCRYTKNLPIFDPLYYPLLTLFREYTPEVVERLLPTSPAGSIEFYQFISSYRINPGSLILGAQVEIPKVPKLEPCLHLESPDHLKNLKKTFINLINNINFNDSDAHYWEDGIRVRVGGLILTRERLLEGLNHLFDAVEANTLPVEAKEKIAAILLVIHNRLSFHHLPLSRDYSTLRLAAIGLYFEEDAEGLENAMQLIFHFDQLSSYFDTINFYNPYEKGYINPALLRDDEDRKITVEETRGGLVQLLGFATTQSVFTGTPPEHKRQELLLYYHNLRQYLQLISLNLQNQLDPEDLARHLIDLSIAGFHCGERWIGDAEQIYALSLPNNNPAVVQCTALSLGDRIHAHDATLRLGIVEELATPKQHKVINVHRFNQYKRLIGMTVGIRGAGALRGIDDGLGDSALSKEIAMQQFMSKYTLAHILIRHREFLNTLYANRNMRDAIANLLIETMPPEWISGYGDGILAKIQAMQEANKTRREIRKMLKTNNYLIRPDWSAKTALRAWIDKLEKNHQEMRTLKVWRRKPREERTQLKEAHKQLIREIIALKNTLKSLTIDEQKNMLRGRGIDLGREYNPDFADELLVNYVRPEYLESLLEKNPSGDPLPELTLLAVARLLKHIGKIIP